MELQLPKILKELVGEWREENYSTEYSIISEIIKYNRIVLENGESRFRYLRRAQLEALETYWYLRLIMNTPNIPDLFKLLFISEKSDFSKDKNFLQALGIPINEEIFTLYSKGGIDEIIHQIMNNDDFAKKNKMDSLRETLTLQYPSYILALAMGAGKTVLIGSIIATEMVLSIEYPESSFVKNALVFAPGKTIFGALREIINIPYEKILPPRLYKEFITKVKFTYTKDNEKDIPIVKGSLYNVIVTNTEKIRIQKGTITKNLLDYLFKDKKRIEEAKDEIANLRLQTIASLPNLAIFSDEAHHTYGNALEKGLKRVRQTVNYLARNTTVIAVINTTGTPFFKKQLLKDVIYWYSLSEGIVDGILKEVRGNIIGFENVEDETFVKNVILDFFDNYKDVSIYDGSRSKIAFYFPKIDDIQNFRPIIEKVLLEIGLDPSLILEVHNKSSNDIKDLFDHRINDPSIPYRVFLLVNKGTEGWNCLSLFATALARELRSSNNFCLQAATRCLREIPDNTEKAKIYLSEKNVKLFDAQLKDTYGENLNQINSINQERVTKLITIKKTQLEPILLKIKRKKIVKIKFETDSEKLKFKLPSVEAEEQKRVTYGIKNKMDETGILQKTTEEILVINDNLIDIFTLANDLSANYHIPVKHVFNSLSRIYHYNLIPQSHVNDLKKQIEVQIRKYDVKESVENMTIDIIKKECFEKTRIKNQDYYTMEMSCKKEKAKALILNDHELDNINVKNYGFHYSPYFFDSKPEKDFYINIIKEIYSNNYEVEDIFFTGGLIDPNKTEFYFEYLDEKGKPRLYYPDFLIKMKNGRQIIIEVKMERLRDDNLDGENGLKAQTLKEISILNKNIEYMMLFTSSSQIGFDNIQEVKHKLAKYKEVKK